jgi:tetratricopeptide (TPR) repeat protein
MSFLQKNISSSRIIACLALLLLLQYITNAQSDTEQRKFRLAESYEQSGDFKSAARIYQELYDGNRRQPPYFDGVARTLMALNQPAALLPLVEEQIQLLVQTLKQPGQATRMTDLHAMKGDLLWKIGKTSQAEEAWKQGLTYAPTLQPTYSTIARSQSSNRAFELAIATLKQARTQLSAQTLFSDELSQLYGAVGNYTAGAQETLTFLRQTNNVNTAQGRIAAYLINAKGTEQSKAVLEQAAVAEPNNFALQRVYAWFLREIKDYNAALEATRRIDDLLNAQGRELLMFAEKARQERFYDAALKGYGMVIDKGKRNPNALNAFYGYARTMESRSQEGAKGFSERDVAQIVERYRAVIADYPGTQFAAESQYRIARLMLDNVGKTDANAGASTVEGKPATPISTPEAAEQEFLRLLELYKQFPIAARGAVDLGKFYFRQNKTEKADAMFRTTLQTFARQKTECDEAEFQLAELEYFAGRLDSAEQRFSRLAANTNADIANDALERLGMLELKKTPEGLQAITSFAKAERAERQGSADDAVQDYTALVVGIKPNAPSAVLGEQALVKAGQIEASRKRYAEAQKLYEQVLTQFPEGTMGDYATMYQGDILAAQGKKDEAIQMYSQVLARFPRSTLLQEVRLKIRKLRGDA